MLDGVRDPRSAMIETGFHLLSAAPPAAALGQRRVRRISEAPREDLRSLVNVQDALDRIDQGGFAEGLIRMMIFLAHSRKEVRRSRLGRANQMLMSTEPFASMKPKHHRSERQASRSQFRFQFRLLAAWPVSCRVVT
jgi:tellurite resistance protein